MAWLKKTLFTLVGIALIFVGARFFLYWKDYRTYARLALSQEAQLKELGNKVSGQGPTGFLNPDEGIVVLTGDRNRIGLALELLALRGSQFLIISGTGKGATLTDLINTQKASSLDLKAIWEKIILEAQSTSTIENAIECSKILRTKKVTRVILVTSDYHMSRSLALFKKFSPEVDYVVYPTISEFTEALEGKMDRAVEGFYKFMLEFLKDSLFTFYLLRV